MESTFKNKVVVITGSGQGIGKALAIHMVKAGAKVVINDYDPSKLAISLDEISKISSEYHGFLGDISDWETCHEMVRQTIDTFGKIDYLVNNAGIATRGSTEDLYHEIYESMVKINILGSIYPTKAALPYLRESKGYVLFISSTASFHGLPYNGIYGATKRALTAFEQSLHLETHFEGIGTGIAYIGFTENDPKKVIIDTNGERVYLPHRNGIKKNSRSKVATMLAHMMAKRKRKKVFGLQGLTLRFLTIAFPTLLEKYLNNRRLFIKSQSEVPSEKADAMPISVHSSSQRRAADS